jgi:hypothetical protein
MFHGFKQVAKLAKSATSLKNRCLIGISGFMAHGNFMAEVAKKMVLFGNRIYRQYNEFPEFLPDLPRLPALIVVLHTPLGFFS